LDPSPPVEMKTSRDYWNGGFYGAYAFPHPTLNFKALTLNGTKSTNPQK